MLRGVSVLAVVTMTSLIPVGRAADLEEVRDVAYGSDPMQRLDIYLPKSAKGTYPAVLWIHGGGWREGDKRTGDNAISTLAKDLVERGFIAVACNYRLVPQHRHPAQVEDVRQAVRWLREHAARYHLDPDRIGAAGISAGGHLACMLAVDGKSRRGEKREAASQVRAAVSLNGVTDLREGAEFMTPPLAQTIRDLVGKGPDAAAARTAASPVTLVSKEAAPLLLIVGEKDPLVPIGQSKALAAALKKQGAEAELLTIEGAGHGIFPSTTPKAKEALLEFFAKHLKPCAPPPEPEWIGESFA